jgi:small subunit ribosomal protein S4
MRILHAPYNIVNIPSYQLKPGDVVGVREKSKSLQIIINSLDNNSSVYEWLTWNRDTLQGNFVTIPQRLQIPENIKEQLIVELYSK